MGGDELSDLSETINEMLADLEKYYEEQNHQKETIKNQAIHDGLTGLYNRIYFDEKMAGFKDLSQVFPLSIMLIDVDGLKLVNDTFGHKAGDDLLSAAAQIIFRPFRKTDIISRIGGDEFCLILPGIDETTAENKKNEILEAVREFNEANPPVPLSLSVGTATSDGSEDENIYDVYQRADENMYQHKFTQSDQYKRMVIDMLLEALKQRDFEADGHIERLVNLAELMARELDLSESARRDLLLLARVHDLGKVGIPEHILNKPGRLSQEEFRKMMQHSQIGDNIASRTPELYPVAKLILHHHENWDGSGYPSGLKGEEIPLASRIISILDAFDAMTSPRPYRTPVSVEEALAEIENCSGIRYDPALVQVFKRVIAGLKLE